MKVILKYHFTLRSHRAGNALSTTLSCSEAGHIIQGKCLEVTADFFIENGAMNIKNRMKLSFKQNFQFFLAHNTLWF